MKNRDGSTSMMRLVIEIGQQWTASRWRWLRRQGLPHFRRDVYAWVVVPHKPPSLIPAELTPPGEAEDSQTIKLLGIHDFRPFSFMRVVWRFRDRGKRLDALGQVLSMTHEQSSRVIMRFTESHARVAAYGYRRGQGPATMKNKWYIATEPKSPDLGSIFYGEPAVILIDRRRGQDHFMCCTKNGAIDVIWHQAGWAPSLIAKPSGAHSNNGFGRDKSSATVQFDVRTLSAARGRSLVDQLERDDDHVSRILRNTPDTFTELSG